MLRLVRRYLSGSVMGQTGFACWIGLACLWAVVAACTIVLLPPIEALRSGADGDNKHHTAAAGGGSGIPAVQMDSMSLQENVENPVASGGGVPSVPSDAAATVPAAATTFLQERKQQQAQAPPPSTAAAFLQERRQQHQGQDLQSPAASFVPEQADL
jgi:hypothetical protein